MQIQYVNSMDEFLLLWSSSIISQDNSRSQLSTDPSSTSQIGNTENNLHLCLSTGTSIRSYKSKGQVKAPGTQSWEDSFKSHRTPAPGGGNKLHSQKTDIFPRVSTGEGSQRCLAIYIWQSASLDVRDDFITKCIKQLWHILVCPEHVCSCSWKWSLGARSSCVWATALQHTFAHTV